MDALDTYFQVAEMSKTPTKKQSYTQMPLIWDTGASIGLTPYRSDFIDYQELENVSVKDITRQNKGLGLGTVMWKFTTQEGREVFLPLVCYHVEHAAIRFMSLQQYFKSHGGWATVLSHSVTCHLPDKAIIDIPIDAKLDIPKIWNGSTLQKSKGVLHRQST